MAGQIKQALLDEGIGIFGESADRPCLFATKFVVHFVSLKTHLTQGNYAGCPEQGMIRITKSGKIAAQRLS